MKIVSTLMKAMLLLCCVATLPACNDHGSDKDHGHKHE